MRVLWAELKNKKIMSKEVEEQINYLMEHPEYVK